MSLDNWEPGSVSSLRKILEVGFRFHDVERSSSHVFGDNLIDPIRTLRGDTEICGKNTDIVRQLRILLRSDSLEPFFDGVDCNLELQSYCGKIDGSLLIHLFAQDRKSIGGDLRLAVEGGNLFPAGISLALGVPSIVYVDSGQHYDQQHVGDGCVGHDLVDAESENLF